MEKGESASPVLHSKHNEQAVDTINSQGFKLSAYAYVQFPEPEQVQERQKAGL